MEYAFRWLLLPFEPVRHRWYKREEVGSRDLVPHLLDGVLELLDRVELASVGVGVAAHVSPGVLNSIDIGWARGPCLNVETLVLEPGSRVVRCMWGRIIVLKTLCFDLERRLQMISRSSHVLDWGDMAIEEVQRRLSVSAEAAPDRDWPTTECRRIGTDCFALVSIHCL